MRRAKWHIKVRSVFCDRAEAIRAQQAADADPRIPQACIGRTIWLAVQMPFEDQREQAGVGDETADRLVLGDLAEPDRSGVADRGQRGAVAGERHRGQHRAQALSSRPRDFPFVTLPR
jgi:hypothetical protein